MNLLWPQVGVEIVRMEFISGETASCLILPQEQPVQS